MNKNDARRFSELMMGLAEDAGATVTQPGIKMKFKALAEFSIEDIEAAAYNVLKHRQYNRNKMPTVADFIEAIKGRAEDKASLKGVEVLQAIKRIGHNDSVDFGDPVTHAVIAGRFGGWVKLCRDLMEDKEGWFLKDFEAVYAAYSRAGQGHGGHLAGLIEEDNLAAGYTRGIPRPILIAEQPWVMEQIEARDNKRLTDE